LVFLEIFLKGWAAADFVEISRSMVNEPFQLDRFEDCLKWCDAQLLEMFMTDRYLRDEDSV